MTPKEKASSLYNMFLPLVQNSHLYDTYKGKAKRCALITVLVVLEILDNEGYDEEGGKMSYWEEVKQEIKQL